MNPQLERLFHSVRRGIESNVKNALGTMDLVKKKDLSALQKRIDRFSKHELTALKAKIDEVIHGLNRVEALKPYISAIKTVSKQQPKRKKGRTTSTKRKRKSTRLSLS